MVASIQISLRKIKEICHTFVEIDIVPPLHCYDIAEPHVSNLMSLSRSNSLLSSQIQLFRVNQERARSSRD